ncbi:MAG: hypothetical protein NTY08_11115 [Proteobacteria bacterium]|nr:hypothetical protein [Pseudomonadota bacterium]
MKTKKTKLATSEKSDAMAFMEKTNGGPLTISAIIKSLRLCD